MVPQPSNPFQHERLRELAEMAAATGPIPPALLAEARELWRVRPAAELDLDRDQEVCLRVVELLAERWGAEVVGVLSIPEQEDRTNPAVELVVGSTAGRVALEHTTIESFRGQIQAQFDLQKLILSDSFEVPGLDPDSQYTLIVKPSSLEGNAKDVETTREALLGWIEEAAAMLPPEPCLPRDRGIRAPEGRLPIQASLLRTGAPEGSPLAGKVTASLVAPEDLETLREARLLAALDSKLPKLIAARGRDGLAVLVMETFDMSAANPWVISEALQRAAGTCKHPLPDYVVLIRTFGASSAWVLYDQGSWPDEPPVRLVLPA